jgi:outer membrane protein OmpA-like peptidoglycan-associated protein
MAVLRHALAVAMMLTAVISAQPQVPAFPLPAGHPETVGGAQDFPYLPPLPGARLIQSSRIEGPLELKAATADDEAVLAGMSFVQKMYAPARQVTSMPFVVHYRDALYASGWKLIDVPKLGEKPSPPETSNVAAHYTMAGRNLYARVSLDPDGTQRIHVADVGAEDWTAILAKECRLRVPSIHFDLDRASIKTVESELTLLKLAELLKTRTAPAVEIQGHMDNIGEAGTAERLALSEARAKAVADWLTSHGVPAANVAAKGYGKQRPIAENDSDLGRALNRRIEVARRDCTR